LRCSNAVAKLPLIKLIFDELFDDANLHGRGKPFIRHSDYHDDICYLVFHFQPNIILATFASQNEEKTKQTEEKSKNADKNIHCHV
jgi:hypothetical protein